MAALIQVRPEGDVLCDPASPLQCLVVVFFFMHVHGALCIYLIKYLALQGTDEIGCGFTSILQVSTGAWRGKGPNSQSHLFPLENQSMGIK